MTAIIEQTRNTFCMIKPSTQACTLRTAKARFRNIKPDCRKTRLSMAGYKLDYEGARVSRHNQVLHLPRRSESREADGIRETLKSLASTSASPRTRTNSSHNWDTYLPLSATFQRADKEPQRIDQVDRVVHHISVKVRVAGIADRVAERQPRLASEAEPPWS